MRVLAAPWAILLWLSVSSVAQTLNPTPFINQPLNPASTAPGGGGFTLTVNGTGFLAGSVVNWNGSPRPTTFVNSSQLTAAIGASDITVSATAAVTVLNPAPGGGASNVVFLTITQPTTSVSLARSDLATSSAPFSVAVGDFTGTGSLSLATANYGSNTVSVLLGNGDGTFAGAVDYPTGNAPTGIVSGDFNHDGVLDLAVANSADGTVSVLLGNGDGTFGAKTDFSVGSAPFALRAADLNGDGNLDLVVANSGSATISVLLGNGDGTFTTAVSFPTGNNPESLVIGDFNGDAKLDVAVADNADNLVSVLLGNGDGTFLPKVDYPAQSPRSLAVGDLNGDGFLDLVTASSGSNEVSVLLGNGDGTFASAVTYPSPGSAHSVVVGDLNGDGKLDLAVADFDTSQISLLLGNGDGTFQSHLDFSTPASAETVAIGDFNGDGRLDVAAAIYSGSTVSVFLQAPAVSLSATSLTFGNQNVGTTSAAQSTTLTNSGSATLNISGISITGQNSGDFTQTNTCIPSGNTTGTLAAGANCSISVTFAPTATGTRTAAVAIADNAGDSPQTVNLTGTGVAPSVSLSPTSLTFTSQVVGTTSAAQPVSLSNTGTGPLTVTAVSASMGFATTTHCVAASPLQPGTGCTESVTFTPPSAGVTSGTLTFTDNDNGIAGSTQSVNLSGTGIKGNTTTTINSATPSPSVVGQTVTITFTVAPPAGDALNPGGSVTVTASSGESCGGTAPSGGCLLVFVTAGSRSLTAAYPGDNNFNGSSSAAVSQTVSKATTSTVLTSSVNPSVVGQTVTFTSTVSGQFGGTPTGSVTFKRNSTTLGTGTLSGGTAIFSTSTLPLGSSSITAGYGGDANFFGSTSSSLTQKVNKITTTTTLTSSLNPSLVGQNVTFTATVTSGFGSPPDGETITFKQGTTTLASVALSGGSANFSTSSLPAGSTTVTAAYPGDSTFVASLGSVKQTVETPCPANGWCAIYTAPPPNFHSNGWDQIAYAPDTNRFYLLMSNGGGITPESNSFYSYSIQPAAAVGNPWTKVSSCGNGLGPAPTEVNRQGMILAESITATTGTCQGGCTSSDYIHLRLDTGGATNITSGTNPLYHGNTTNGSGVVWIGNEAIRYGKCTSTNSFSGTVCGTNTGGDMYLWGTSDGTSAGSQAALIRGTRQTAGWGPPQAHQGGSFKALGAGGGEPAGWACYNPELGPNWNFNESPTDITGTDHDAGVNRAGSWDHPGERHSVANEIYDSARGRLWAQFGFEESWQWQDTWSLCVQDKGGAGGGNALSVCGASDVYTATATTPGWQRMSWPESTSTPPYAIPLYTWTTSGAMQNSGIAENASIYDPQNDVLVEMGGLAGGSARHEILIFCMSPASSAFGCNSGNVGTWVMLKPTTTACGTTGHYCGDTGGRDGARLAYDSVNKRVVLFGGSNAQMGSTAWYYDTVAQYDAHTGDLCLSSTADSSQHTANSSRSLSWCPLPALSGNPPPEKNGTGVWNINLKFPSWAFDSGLGEFAFYGGNGSGVSTNGGNADDPSIEGVWLYNSMTNVWSQPSLSGTAGPQIPGTTSYQSWAYDSVDGQLVWVTGASATQLWQIPDAALGP